MYLFLPHARSYPNLQALYHSFWFSFLFSRQLIQVACISKLYWEEKSSNSCNCSYLKITVATIHWSFKPQTFLEATELLHFLTLSSLPFCSSLHLSPTDVPDMWDMPWSWGIERTLQLSQTEMLQGQSTLGRNRMWRQKILMSPQKETEVDCENEHKPGKLMFVVLPQIITWILLWITIMSEIISAASHHLHYFLLFP